MSVVVIATPTIAPMNVRIRTRIQGTPASNASA